MSPVVASFRCGRRERDSLHLFVELQENKGESATTSVYDSVHAMAVSYIHGIRSDLLNSCPAQTVNEENFNFMGLHLRKFFSTHQALALEPRS
jgi:hypothetical protein